MKRAGPVALTVTIAALLLTAAPNEASATTTPPTATKFVLTSFGYATRASGGTVPVSSNRTAYQVIGCTTYAGLSKDNTQVGVISSPVTSITGAATSLWTFKSAAKVSSWARDSIAEATVAGVTLTGITGTSHAYYDSGFQQQATSALATISYGGQSYPVPSAGTPLTIPGVATITVGDSSASATYLHGAVSDIAAVRVDVLATGATVILGKAHSTISGGAAVGVFGGQTYASQATAAAPVANSGPTPLLVMACQGTHGATVTRDAANVALPDTALIGAATTAERGQQVGDTADMWTRGTVANALLFTNSPHELTISGIEAQAHVWFVRGTTATVQRSSAGTTPGQITYNGSPVVVPPSGTVTIPDVATIETNLVTMTAQGLQVIAVRVTLVNGTGAVVNLGYASASLTPSV
jgi:hypothetical protein